MYLMDSLLNFNDLVYSFLNFRDPEIVAIRPRNRHIYHHPGGLDCQDLVTAQIHPEKSANFKPVSRATKLMKIVPRATQNHEKCNPRHPDSNSKMTRKKTWGKA